MQGLHRPGPRRLALTADSVPSRGRTAFIVCFGGSIPRNSRAFRLGPKDFGRCFGCALWLDRMDEAILIKCLDRTHPRRLTVVRGPAGGVVMGYATYIGRVGGLAVALGAGHCGCDHTLGGACRRYRPRVQGPPERRGPPRPAPLDPPNPKAPRPPTAPHLKPQAHRPPRTPRRTAPPHKRVVRWTSPLQALPRRWTRRCGRRSGGRCWPPVASSRRRSRAPRPRQRVMRSRSRAQTTRPRPNRMADFEEATDLEAPAPAKAPVNGPRGGSDTNQRPVDKPTGVPRVDANTITATANAAPSLPEPSESVRRGL